MTTTTRWIVTCAVTITAVWVACSKAAAQAPPSYDFQFSTIGAPGNPAYNGPDPFKLVTGRGSVAYEYRIGTLEVTTSQWMEFVNTYSVLGGSWTFFADPVFWGAEPDPGYSGPGRKWRLRNVPDAERLPVTGITWERVPFVVGSGWRRS